MHTYTALVISELRETSINLFGILSEDSMNNSLMIDRPAMKRHDSCLALLCFPALIVYRENSINVYICTSERALIRGTSVAQVLSQWITCMRKVTGSISVDSEKFNWFSLLMCSAFISCTFCLCASALPLCSPHRCSASRDYFVRNKR